MTRVMSWLWLAAFVVAIAMANRTNEEGLSDG